MKAPSGSKTGLVCLCVEQCAVACLCSTGEQAPCVQLSLVYAEKAQLCDQLEAIADSLPLHVDPALCLDVANRLLPLMRESHRYEEDVLFPVFERGDAALASRQATVRRLKSEHVYDEGAAEEICEQLRWIGNGGDIENPEALGFMLRAFFDTVRRHVAFEREYVFPAMIANQPIVTEGNA